MRCAFTNDFGVGAVDEGNIVYISQHNTIFKTKWQRAI